MEPPVVIGIGYNYRVHAIETDQQISTVPNFFLKAPPTVIGPNQPIILPSIAPDKVDYEAELSVVIGKKARAVSEEHALDFVLGYTCGNDVTVRDWQISKDSNWVRGKTFDTFAPSARQSRPSLIKTLATFDAV